MTCPTITERSSRPWDAAGFIKINALRLRLLAMRDRRLGKGRKEVPDKGLTRFD